MKKKKNAPTRLVVISDLHCGSFSGLTPKQYEASSNNPSYKNFEIARNGLWSWYKRELESLYPITYLVENGDAIHGKESKQGSTFLLESDITVQCDMAVECINVAKAEKVFMTYGTGYHCGSESDNENYIASRVNAKIKDHLFLDINGLKMDIKHHVGSSSIPHGRATPILREKLWNIIWNNKGELQVNSNVLIRSHVHHHTFAGTPEYLVMTTPCLQGYGSKIARRLSGVIDLGFIHFDINPDGSYTWQPHIFKVDFLKVTVEKL